MARTNTNSAARIIFTGILAALPVAAGTAAHAQPAPPPAPAADTPDVRDARAAAKAFATALGEADLEKARGLFGGTPDDFKAVETTHAAMRSMARFKAAAIKAFPELAKETGNDLTAESLAAGLDRQAAKADGDRVAFGDGVVVAKAGGQWKVIDLYGNQMAKQMMPAMLTAMTKAVDETTPEIEAGRYKTQQELKQAVQGKMAAAMMANRPPTPGAATKPATRPSR